MPVKAHSASTALGESRLGPELGRKPGAKDKDSSDSLSSGCRLFVSIVQSRSFQKILINMIGWSDHILGK